MNDGKLLCLIAFLFGGLSQLTSACSEQSIELCKLTTSDWKYEPETEHLSSVMFESCIMESCSLKIHHSQQQSTLKVSKVYIHKVPDNIGIFRCNDNTSYILRPSGPIPKSKSSGPKPIDNCGDRMGEAHSIELSDGPIMIKYKKPVQFCIKLSVRQYTGNGSPESVEDCTDEDDTAEDDSTDEDKTEEVGGADEDKTGEVGGAEGNGVREGGILDGQAVHNHGESRQSGNAEETTKAEQVGRALQDDALLDDMPSRQESKLGLTLGLTIVGTTLIILIGFILLKWKRNHLLSLKERNTTAPIFEPPGLDQKKIIKTNETNMYQTMPTRNTKPSDANDPVEYATINEKEMMDSQPPETALYDNIQVEAPEQSHGQTLPSHEVDTNQTDDPNRYSTLLVENSIYNSIE